MLFSFATALPFFVTIIWFITSIMSLKAAKGRGAFCFLTAVTSAYFFCEMHYLMPGDDFSNFAILDISNNFFALCIPPLIYAYMRAIRGKKPDVSTLIYFLPAMIMGGVAATIYFLMGFDNAAAYHEARYATAGNPVGFDGQIYRLCDLWCIKIFDGLLIVEFILTIIILLGIGTRRKFDFRRFIRFLKGKDTFKPLDIMATCLLAVMVVSAIRAAIGPFILIENKWLSILLSLLTAGVIFMMGFIERRNYEVDVPLDAIFHYYNWTKTRFGEQKGDVKTQVKAPQAAEAQEEEKEETVNPDIPGVSKAEKTQELLLKQFNEYMEHDKPFLNPNYGIKDITEDLHTNKTYISNLVNQVFSMSFRDYINKKRIDYSKMLLRNNRRASLEEIAVQSGFLSASQFNKKFKELEGFTPSQWKTLKKEE